MPKRIARIPSDLSSYLGRGAAFQGSVLMLLLYLSVFALTAVASGTASAQGTALFRVTLANGLTGELLGNQKVVAVKKMDEEYLWIASHYTDTKGSTSFELEALGNGASYVFFARPYGGFAQSQEIVEPGDVSIEAGMVLVTVSLGTTGEVLTNNEISVWERKEGGQLKWFTIWITDSDGKVIFDLPGLGQGRRYLLAARSPWDDSNKFSQEIAKTGPVSFEVGNAPLLVTLVNGITGQPVPGIQITAKERLPDGSLIWVRSDSTDADGQTVFDLDGLGAGRVYVMVASPYNGGAVVSPNLTETGQFEFPVGKLQVKVISGVDDAALVQTMVVAYRLLESGEKQWVMGGLSDEEGIIRFDLPQLGAGAIYVLGAVSPADNTTKFSREILENGEITFRVGNPPLRMTLVDAINNEPLPGIKVTARTRDENGKLDWVISHTTDGEGLAVFDLDGLGKGQVYRLSATPYNGGAVYTEEITKPGDLEFRVGAVPITLIDADNNLVMPDIKLVAHEKMEDGTLHWRKSGVTDAQGMVRFDLPGLDQDHVYVISAIDPFSNQNLYYSPWITREGAVDFIIGRDENHRLDKSPPWISINSPASGALVSDLGFTLKGRASDDRELREVRVTVTDPVLGDQVAVAQLDPLSGYWSFPVTAAMMTVQGPVRLAAKAYDQAHNATSVSLQVQVIKDVSPPSLSISSHRNGDVVAGSGFLVFGDAVDDTGLTRLVATVEDPILGITLDGAPVQVVDSSGRWTLRVTGDQVSIGNLINVRLQATDAAGNQTDRSVELQVVEVSVDAVALIKRITFGASPRLLQEVDAMGAIGYLEQQLNPGTVDDSEFQAILNDWVPQKTQEMTTYQLAHAIYSRRQLQEIMTWFWDNHFNTDIGKTRRVAYELAENRGFREYALGYFRDLLQVSATSPAMLIYLDNANSRKQTPNENYARELMELHTLGVDGGYTEQDVAEAARSFTGWGVRDGAFYFNAGNHDTQEKRVLGYRLPPGRGMEEGEEILDILAAHPSTAHFICTKLLRLFVSDTPKETVVDECAAAYLSTNGHIGEVVSQLLYSTEFNAAENFHSKVKTPLEFIVSVVRNLQAQPGEQDLSEALDSLGMPLFRDPIPTGWPETGDEWINSNQLMQRIQFVKMLAFNPPDASGRRTSVSPRELFLSAGYETAEGIVGYLFALTMANDYSDLEWDLAMGVLTQDGRVPFDIHAADADARLRHLLANVLSYPSYQLQ